MVIVAGQVTWRKMAAVEGVEQRGETYFGGRIACGDEKR